MKVVFLLLFLLCNLPLFAQDFPISDKTGKICYTEVVHVDSTVTKEILYYNAREWFAKSFKSANDVIQMDDKDAGKIIGKGSFKVERLPFLVSDDIGNAGWINFTISVFVKPGRYKYEITDFFHQPNRAFGAGSFDNPQRMNSKKSWKHIQNQTKREISLIISSLKKEMSLKKISNDEDW